MSRKVRENVVEISIYLNDRKRSWAWFRRELGKLPRKAEKPPRLYDFDADFGHVRYKVPDDEVFVDHMKALCELMKEQFLILDFGQRTSWDTLSLTPCNIERGLEPALAFCRANRWIELEIGEDTDLPE